VTAGTPTCAPGVEFLGYSDALDKQRLEGTMVGGLSALAYDPARDLYYSLVDNERTAPARFYTLRAALERGRLAGVQLVAVTVLRDAAGRPFTGLDFDGEGLALTADGELLISSETEPAIRRFSLDGRLLAELPEHDLAVDEIFRAAEGVEVVAHGTSRRIAESSDAPPIRTCGGRARSPFVEMSQDRRPIVIFRTSSGVLAALPRAGKT
jgi:hypothetical protein